MSPAVLAIDYTQGLNDAWSKIATFVPKLVAFFAVLIVGSIVTRIVARIVGKVLGRAGFDRTMARVGLTTYTKKLGAAPSALVARFVKVVLTFVTFTTALSVFGPDNPISRFVNSAVNYLPRVVVAVAICAVAAVAARWAGAAMQRVVTEGNLPRVLARVVPVSIWMLAAFASLDQLQIAPNTVHMLFNAFLAVVVGSAIVAVGGGGIQPMRGVWEHTLQRYAPSVIDLSTTDQEPARV